MRFTLHASVLSVVVACLLGLAAGPSGGPGLDVVMRKKLVHTQKILEAVVTSDWASLQTQSGNLDELTKDPRWTELNYPEYGHHSDAFLSAIRDLRAAAAQREHDETPKAYVALTLQCIACHRYLARARIAAE